MKRPLAIGSTLLLVGAFLFWFLKFELPSQTKGNSPISQINIAEIISARGFATLKNTQDEISMLTLQSKIFQNNSLSTDQDSGVIFQLSSGAKFEMAPLTKIVFESLSANGSANVSITILEGQIQLLSNESTLGSFEVSKKGKSLSLEELKTNIEKLKPILPELSQIRSTTIAESTPVEKKSTKLATGQKQSNHERSSLDQEDINKVMRNQTSFLHRCYINYMLRSQRLDLSGQVVLSFVIQPTGKVINPKVISTPIQDEQLDRCLTDVIGRASFKEFSSRAILVQAYPIHLD